MIFVTVGTHEQPFNRLIEEIDRLKQEGVITDEVQMQTGYCTYEPKYCKWETFFPYKKMQELVQEADIVITHGGPSSFIMPLQYGKIPIVVPRQAKYQEHINNHQLEFVHAVEERQKNIIGVYEISDLESVIRNYMEIAESKNLSGASNNQRFNDEFSRIVEECMKEKL